MHFCTFVLIANDGDVETLVAKAFEPFNEDLEVLPYRSYFSFEDVKLMSRHYKIPLSNLHGLAERMPDWVSRPGGVDRKGLYELSITNPDGRWDWYEIGGRYDSLIKGAQQNVIGAEELVRSPELKECLPYYVLTPYGDWLEAERFFFEGVRKGVRVARKTDKAWLAEVKRTLEKSNEHRVVCVDIHR